MSPKIMIGLIGQRGSGKSTFATHICNKYGFHEYAYGTAVKQICQQMFLLTDEQLVDRELKEAIDPRWGMSPRQMFQWMGTNIVRRQLDDKFWINRINHEMVRDGHNMIVVSDVRFQNELDNVHEFADKHGYRSIIIRISRTEVADSHESEQLTDLIADITLSNMSTKTDFMQLVDEYVQSHLIPKDQNQVSQESSAIQLQPTAATIGQHYQFETYDHDPNVHAGLCGMLLHA